MNYMFMKESSGTIKKTILELVIFICFHFFFTINQQTHILLHHDMKNVTLKYVECYFKK